MYLHQKPMRAFRFGIHPSSINVSQLSSHIINHKMGPCERLDQTLFRLLWANSSSLEVAVHLDYRTMWLFCFGDHLPSFKWYGPMRPPVYPMGQCRPFVPKY